MICKMLGGWFRHAALALPVFGLLAAWPANAALIGLSYGGLPDVAGAPDITYDYTAGVGGTLTINGRLTAPATVGGVAVPNGGATNTITQTIKFPNLTASPLEYLYVTNDVADDSNTAYNAARRYTNYSLTASFDANGLFTGGTVSILGYLSDATKASIEAYYGQTWSDSGTILSANLADFGFYGDNADGNTIDTIKFQFRLNVTGGDVFNLGFNGGAAEYVGGVSTLASGGASPLLAAGGTTAMNWDDLTVSGQQKAFMQDFIYCSSGCTSTMDTWVPLPGAVWLFGSGLAALAGLARRRKAAR